MNRNLIKVALMVVLVQCCLSCGSDGGDDKPGLIDPSDSDALSEVLIMPGGTDQRSGNPPTTTVTPETPEVDAITPEITSSNGNTFVLVFSYSGVTGDLAGAYIQVNGAGTYFDINFAAGSGSSGQISIPIGIPTNVDEGEFDLDFSIYDEDDRVSEQVNASVNVLKLGSGSLQVSLSWNNDSDQDLYVEDPSGTSINYTNPFSDTGGELDRDDTDGYGPENIFWNESAPDGTYTVSVDDYSGETNATTWVVTINAPGKSKTFTGTTQNGSVANVVTFTKNGNSYSF
ncbi:MAG TPA: hypothetical protein VGK59_08015 [Ohtaekwangia sp.]